MNNLNKLHVAELLAPQCFVQDYQTGFFAAARQQMQKEMKRLEQVNLNSDSDGDSFARRYVHGPGHSYQRMSTRRGEDRAAIL
jgi:hypothetical protein